ncbi:serine/threonine-protein kinase [Nocardioides sp. cx-173]|uniref:serine/threonine-protein kinase n=1 Tax=Nocardioides sp. cx-173 TaxID=2898796 RepID=UPI001E650B8B|nr:serine/threonine-protein kinase [Nocardioides sp. cx-173]MCD4525522.1 serine/threonine protein kinase [Nocardioides sp. cx-173]UGB42666.1 serine/threonine protein kinase [Nocardioides sp. cx-173]
MSPDEHPRDPDPTEAVDMSGLLGDQPPPTSVPAPDLLGGRYRLGPVLGRGGVADVHRATDTLLSREVAVKRLREATPSDVDRARFTAEARTLAVLSHRSLVTLLDAGESEDRPYLVLELVEGPTLAALMAAGPLPVREAAYLLGDVAAALAYAHAQGVVHRDVKPGNVLVGDDGRVRLADFGIARIVGDAVRHTMTGTTVGTVGYLAPEQVSGAEIGPAVDVYALGLVLLEAVTGIKAFTGSTAEAAVARLARDPHVPDDLAPALADLVRAMTARDPAARPSAAVVAERLALIAADDATTLVPLVPPARRRVRPVLVAAAAAVALAVALAGVGLFGGGEPSQAERPADSSSTSPSSAPSGAAPSTTTSPAVVRSTTARAAPKAGPPKAKKKGKKKGPKSGKGKGPR